VGNVAGLVWHVSTVVSKRPPYSINLPNAAKFRVESHIKNNKILPYFSVVSEMVVENIPDFCQTTWYILSWLWYPCFLYVGLEFVSEHIQELPVVAENLCMWSLLRKKKRHLRSHFSPRDPGSTQKAFCELQNVITFPSFLKEFHILGVTTRRMVNSGKLNEICGVDAFLKTIKESKCIYLKHLSTLRFFLPPLN